ncbi:DUF3953 domain-containing protein [Bacillus sp. BGMRC 2118]|nr:DUF3953 domain-containing protein [Bacillus sp. BGMRC 2118]
MLLLTRIIFAVIVIILSVYGFVTQNTNMFPYIFMFLSLMMVVIGLDEWKKDRKMYCWISFSMSVVLLLVTFQAFN